MKGHVMRGHVCQCMTLAARDCAKQEFVTSNERDLYLVEETKATILNDLRTLTARIGLEATKDFLRSEFVDLPF